MRLTGSLRRGRGTPGPVARWAQIPWESFTGDRTVGGRRVRYLDHGSGPPLVLLHGMGSSWQWWLENIPALAAHHRVVAIDLPGFGRSEPLPPPAEMATHAQIVLGLLDELEITAGAFVGHSMGGLVAIEIATSAPRFVTKLVLVDAGGVPMPERHLRAVLIMLRMFAAVLRGGFVRKLLSTNKYARGIALRPAFRDTAAMSPELAALTMPLLDAPGFVDAVAAAGRAVRTTRPEAITCPTLLIWGEYDRLAPVRCAEDMHRRLPGSTLQVFERCGHTPQIEFPQRFNDTVLEFTAPGTSGAPSSAAESPPPVVRPEQP